MKDILVRLLGTLDKIEVHGEENVSRLLGCMRAVKAMLDALNSETKDENPE